jgi:hypothetical protein
VHEQQRLHLRKRLFELDDLFARTISREAMVVSGNETTSAMERRNDFSRARNPME